VQTELQPRWQPEVEAIEAALLAVTGDLARLSAGLAPADIDEAGLAAALERLADASPVTVTTTVDVGDIPAAVAIPAYFICAEALTNIAKHARATDATILATDADGQLRLRIDDDGIGGADARGRGLRGLADRAEAAGGRLTIGERPGGGTRLEAVLPLERSTGLR
jgi:signal transduction histidine kinase